MTQYRQPTGLAPLPLLGLGFRGLNTELTAIVGAEDPLWALDLQNVVWGTSGNIESRKGYVDQTSVAMTGTPNVWNLHEYLRNDGTTSLVALADDFKMWASTDDGSTWSDITGSLVTTTVKWRFVNFQDEVYATAPGYRVWRYTGTGSFTEIATSPVTNGALLAAYGRLWTAVDASDSSVIKYSNLLDGTDWTGTGSGSIEASNAWTNGFDTITALASFGAAFIVFGTKHILIYVDGAGSELGIDPTNMYVVDTIEGTGTVHPDSVINIGEGDLWYQGPKGIQSLARVIADKTNPLVDISKNVRTLVKDMVDAHVGSDGYIKAVYSPREEFVLYLYPNSQRIVMFDTRAKLDDDTYRVAEWRSLPFYSLLSRKNGTLLFGGTAGNVHKYTGYRDNGVTKFNVVYGSPWFAFGEALFNRNKIMKECALILYGRETLTGTLRWAFDYRPLEHSLTFSSDYVSSGAEYAIGEYAEDEYGTGHRNRTEMLPLGGEGRFVKLHLTVQSYDVDDKLAITSMTAFAKPGRYV